MLRELVVGWLKLRLELELKMGLKGRKIADAEVTHCGRIRTVQYNNFKE